MGGSISLAHATDQGSGASLEDLCAAMERPSEAVLPLLLELEAAGTLTAEPGLFWRPS
jgi:hypothetical protein